MPDNITREDYDSTSYRPRATSQTARADREAVITKVKNVRLDNPPKAMPEFPAIDFNNAEEVTPAQARELINRTQDELQSVDARISAAEDILYSSNSMLGHYSNEEYPRLNRAMRDLLGVGDLVQEDGFDLTPETLACINKIATYSEPAPTQAELQDPDALTEKIEKNFPTKEQLWPGLLYRLFFMFFTLTVKYIFTSLCKMSRVLPDEIIGIDVGIAIRKMFKKAANYLFYIINNLSAKVNPKIIGVKSYHSFQAYLKEKSVDVCSKQSMDELEDPDTMSSVVDQYTIQEEGCKQCNEGCKPTPEQPGLAKQAIKELLIAQIKNKSNTKTDISSTLILEQLKNQSKNIKESLTGYEIAIEDKPSGEASVLGTVRGTILGHLIMIEELVRGMDITVSRVINLEFISPAAKDFVCCFVRLIFFAFADADKLGSDVTEFLKDGLDSKNINKKLQPNKQTIAILKMLDSVLSYMMGQAQYNMLIQLPIDSEFIMGAMKQALAETLTMFNETISFPINVAFTKMFEIPSFKVAAELCVPFSYVANLATCGFQMLQNKIYELIAKLWMEGNETMKSFDSFLTLSLRVKNLKIFSSLINFVLDNTAALQQFCDVDKLTTPEEIERIKTMLENEIPVTVYDDRVPVPDDNNSDAAKKTKILMTPIFKADDPIGPDDNDFINSQYGRGLAGEFGELDMELSPMYVEPEELEKKWAIEVPIKDSKTITLRAAIGCGNDFKEILAESASAMKELKDENVISHLKLRNQ